MHLSDQEISEVVREMLKFLCYAWQLLEASQQTSAKDWVFIYISKAFRFTWGRGFLKFIGNLKPIFRAIKYRTSCSIMVIGAWSTKWHAIYCDMVSSWTHLFVLGQDDEFRQFILWFHRESFFSQGLQLWLALCLSHSSLASGKMPSDPGKVNILSYIRNTAWYLSKMEHLTSKVWHLTSLLSVFPRHKILQF